MSLTAPVIVFVIGSASVILMMINSHPGRHGNPNESKGLKWFKIIF